MLRKTGTRLQGYEGTRGQEDPRRHVSQARTSSSDSLSRPGAAGSRRLTGGQPVHNLLSHQILAFRQSLVEFAIRSLSPWRGQETVNTHPSKFFRCLQQCCSQLKPKHVATGLLSRIVQKMEMRRQSIDLKSEFHRPFPYNEILE